MLLDDDEFLSPMNDFVFKRLVGDERHPAITTSILQAILPLPRDEYKRIIFKDPHINRSFEDDKERNLDVCIETCSGHMINVEMQAHLTPAYHLRMQSYACKLMSNQIKIGEPYSVIRPVHGIHFCNFTLFPGCPCYYHRFRLYDSTCSMAFPDSMELHTLEAPKAPPESDGTMKSRWLCFLSARGRKRFKSLAEGSPVMEEAVAVLAELTADEEARMLAVSREKWHLDQLTREVFARQAGLEEGRAEGRADAARRMLMEKLDHNLISRITGLTLEQIENLRQRP